MPFYTYIAEDGEEIEELLNMSDLKDTIEKNGKTYKRKKEFSTNFILMGNGWVSKGTEGIPNPTRSIADIGYKVDYDKKKEMES
jgi:hypothetical protein